MKYLATLLLIISFAGIGIFGFAIFDHDMKGSNNACFGSSIGRMECPTSIIGMALHHISGIRTLATATVPPGANWLLLLASLLLILISIFLFYKDSLLPKLEFLRKRLQELALNSLYGRQKVASWLSLLELSPSLR